MTKKFIHTQTIREDLPWYCYTQKILRSSLNAFKLSGIPLPLFLQFIYD